MRDRLIGLLEKADLALASCSGVVDDAALSPLIRAVGAVRTRLAYPEEVLVAALAGGTGSGKSSLFNALTGETLAEVGGVRPTTSAPAAAVPSSAGGSLDGFLDRLGIDERDVYEGHGVCLVDLPDTDSVEVDHRHRVDAVLPLVDLVIWVTDPEKYRDARLHHDYLRPMSEYADQFLFVINQSDRLGVNQLREVRVDLETALAEDGMEHPIVIPVSAAPPAGPPVGLETLGEAIEAKRAARDMLYHKLLTDLAATASALGLETGDTLDFDQRASDAVSTAAQALATGETEQAMKALVGFLDSIAGEAGGVAARRIEALAADLPRHLQRIDDEIESRRKPRRRWFRGRGTTSASQAETALVLITESVIRPVRAVLARRALALASVADLTFEIERLRRDPPR